MTDIVKVCQLQIDVQITADPNPNPNPNPHPNSVLPYTDLKFDKKSPANANGNSQQPLCMFESPVKQSLSQSPEGARRPTAIVSIVFYSYSPDSVTCLARPLPYWLISQIFPTPLSFSTLVWGGPCQIYEKASLILKLESSTQPTVKIW